VDGGDHWTQAARGLGDLTELQALVTTLLVVPGELQTVYLATAGAGVWRSFDGGASWAAVNEGLWSHVVRSLAYAPGNPAALYAATATGVFRLPLVYSRLGQLSHRGAR
jgi:hypothetical protein